MYKKKNIAVLSTLYYPDMGAPSSVMDRFVSLLQDRYNFYIITKTYKILDSFEHKQNITYISGFRHILSLKCERNINSGKFVLMNKLILKSIDVFKLLATQVCRPTANSWENCAYFIELERLNSQVSLDAVISVSNTCFTQFAANKFKKKHPNVRWIQFVTDPFTENYIYYRYKLFPNLWRKINFNDERRFYKNCDAAFLTPELFGTMRKKFPESSSKCYEMQFTLSDLSVYKSSSSPNTTIKLIYAGAVYKDIRNPEFMMQVISKIKEVYLDMFTNKGANRGECDDILERNMSDNIFIHGFVPKEQYNKMICNEYDVLVNIGNISDLQTPSKMLDLLSTGRPILNFYFVEDSQYEMIERYPLGLNIRCGDKNAVNKVKDFCIKAKGKALSFNEVKSLYPKNVLDHQIEQFEKIIKGEIV